MAPVIRGNSAYVIVQGPTWEEAEANAVKLGGHLVTINDAAEWSWFKSQFSPANGYAYPESYNYYPNGEVQLWIGLNDARIEGLYEWVSGQTSEIIANDILRTPNDDYGVWQWEQGKVTTYPNNLNISSPSWADFARNIRGIAEIPLSYFTISDLTLTEGSSGTVTITRTGGTRSTQNLTLTSSNGTATAGSDYTAISSSISFAAGETSKTVAISSIDDSTVESSETFTLTLTASSSDAVPAQISSGTATVTITDNDVAVTPSSFSIDDTNVLEGNAASVLITRTGGLTNAIELTVSTANGTAKSGKDYTALYSTVSFAAGESSKTVSISSVQDTIKESDETFTVSLTSSNTLASFSRSSATVTIEDDDTTTATTVTTTGNGNVINTGSNNTTTINNTTNNVTNVTTTTSTTNNSNSNNTATTNNTTSNTTTNNTTDNSVTNNTYTIGSISVNLSALQSSTGKGADTITGGTTNDVLGAGVGTDYLSGGSGADQFVFNRKDKFGAKGADRITDFNPSEGDQLVVSSTALPGLKSATFAIATTPAQLLSLQTSSSNLIYYQPTGELFYDQNGTKKGFGKGGLFSVLEGAPTLTASNLGILA